MLFDALQDATVRYGHRPQRALVILLTLIAAVALTLTPEWAQKSMATTDAQSNVYTTQGLAGPASAPADPAHPCGGGKVRCFNPLLYAVDTVVPIIDLKQRSTWYPARDLGGTWLEWWLNLCTLLGWAATTIFALSFTRLGRTS
jgi:hypothetical protein